MKTIKVYRASFSNSSGIYFVNFLIDLLKMRYNVVIDNIDPDIVFYSHMFTDVNSTDIFSNKKAASSSDFPYAKKIFMSGEHVHDYSYFLNKNDRLSFTIGIPHSQLNDNSLNVPIFVLASVWQLYRDCKLFESPFNWLTAKKDIDKIISNKKYFCAIIQNVSNPYRKELFTKLQTVDFVKACGGFATNIPNEECPFALHEETADTKNKILFFKNSYFSINVQYEDVPGFTPDKLLQGFAANTIPIFYGNSLVYNDGYNPNAFINCHKFSSVDEVVEEVKTIYNNKDRLKKMLEEPIFIDNKLPDFFNLDTIHSFLEKVVNT